MKAIVVHARCNGPAFYYAHQPVRDEKIKAKYVTTIGGHPAPPHATGMKCGTCHNRLSANELAPGPMIYDMADEDDMNVIYGDYPE